MTTEAQKQDAARMMTIAAHQVSAEKLEALYKHDMEAIFRLFDTQIKTFLSSKEFEEDIAFHSISAVAFDAMRDIVSSVFNFDAISSKHPELEEEEDSAIFDIFKKLDLKLQKAALIDEDAEFLTAFAKELQTRFPDKCPQNLKPVFAEPYATFTFADGSTSPLVNEFLADNSTY